MDFNNLYRFIPINPEHIDRARGWMSYSRITSRFWWFSAYGLFLILTLIAIVSSIIGFIVNLFITPAAILSLLWLLWLIVKVAFMLGVFVAAGALERASLRPPHRTRFFYLGPVFLALIYGVFILSAIRNQTGLGFLSPLASGGFSLLGGAQFDSIIGTRLVVHQIAVYIITLVVCAGAPFLFIKMWGGRKQVALLFASTIGIGVIFTFVPF